jgi:hypothetical protein
MTMTAVLQISFTDVLFQSSCTTESGCICSFTEPSYGYALCSTFPCREHEEFWEENMCFNPGGSA